MHWGNKSIPKVAHSLVEIVGLSSHLQTEAKARSKQEQGQGLLTVATGGS